MPELHVSIEGQRVGIVELGAGGNLRFAYDAAWLDRRGATPLSLSMPLRGGWFEHDVIHPYLWGLLPDNEAVIERWAKQYQCSSSNVFALLANVGGDVAGAAEYLLPGTDPEESAESTYDLLDDAAVAALLREVQRDPTAWRPGRDDGRWSLAGAQSKIALAFDDDRGWSIPHGQAPTTHIFKPAISDLKDHDLNELLCVKAAERLGLLTEEASLGHFEDQRALVLKRYDRIVRDGRVIRVHQEDFCQALGVHPASKYQNDGGPSIEDMVGTLWDSGSSPTEDVARLCDAVAFNWLVLGSDAHAKNYSLILSGRQVRLAPLYDLGSSAPYADHVPKVKLAQKVGGEYRAGRIDDRHWRRLAGAARIDPDAYLGRIDGMAEALPGVLREVIGELGVTSDEAESAAAIIEAIGAWASACRSALGLPASPPSADPGEPTPRQPRRRHPRGTPGGGQFA